MEGGCEVQEYSSLGLGLGYYRATKNEEAKDFGLEEFQAKAMPEPCFEMCRIHHRWKHTCKA